MAHNFPNLKTTVAYFTYYIKKGGACVAALLGTLLEFQDKFPCAIYFTMAHKGPRDIDIEDL